MYLRMIFLGNLWLTVFLLSYFFPATGNAEFFQYSGRWDSFAENEIGLRYFTQKKCKSLVILNCFEKNILIRNERRKGFGVSVSCGGFGEKFASPNMCVLYEHGCG